MIQTYTRFFIIPQKIREGHTVSVNDIERFFFDILCHPCPPRCTIDQRAFQTMCAVAVNHHVTPVS